MKSKWLKFRLLSVGPKTSMWLVENKDGYVIGIIKWQRHWRQYCFNSNEDVVYSQGCLRDIAEFIKEQMDKRKKK